MIYFVRHGQTDMNALGIVQGTIDAPLNKQGKLQAKELKKKLEDIDFEAVYSSPLKRALQTAKIIRKEKVVVDDRLTEQYGGVRQGQKYDDWSEEQKLDYKQNPEKYGAETHEHFYNRVVGFFKEIENSDKNVLIVSHYGVHKIIQEYLGEEVTSIANCEVVIFKR